MTILAVWSAYGACAIRGVGVDRKGRCAKVQIGEEEGVWEEAAELETSVEWDRCWDVWTQDPERGIENCLG